MANRKRVRNFKKHPSRIYNEASSMCMKESQSKGLDKAIYKAKHKNSKIEYLYDAYIHILCFIIFYSYYYYILKEYINF